MLSNGWDDATAALQLLSHLQGDTERGIVSADVSSDIEKVSSGRIVGTLWVADWRTTDSSLRKRLDQRG